MTSRELQVNVFLVSWMNSIYGTFCTYLNVYLNYLMSHVQDNKNQTIKVTLYDSTCCCDSEPKSKFLGLSLSTRVWFFIFSMNMFYVPVLANPGISELFLKAINCEVGVTFVLEEALAFIPQSNRVRIKCSGFWWKELKRYFLWFYGSNINLRVFRILKEGILSILIDWSGRQKAQWNQN